mmetsp:Transcript_58719/g.137016  ORF Transcript_58719/g.137016 Transcript_58719/m.137016 type:complete len:479 (-) Transcript_58719:137-1573(-)
MLGPEEAPRGQLLERAKHLKPQVERESAVKRRREALLAQQSESRSRRIEDVRRIAMEALLGSEGTIDADAEVEVEEEGEDDDTMDVSADRHPSGKKSRRLRQLQRTLFFARQLQVPDWPVAMPEDLSTNWLVLLRPEGERCLLLSEGGKVEIRQKNGHVSERYMDSRLPKGLTILDVVAVDGPTPPSAAADHQMSHEQENQPPESEAIADCDMDALDVNQEMRDGSKPGRGEGRGKGRGRGLRKTIPKGRPKGDRTYAVCDVLVWGDAELVNAEAECRMFWLESRFGELQANPPRRARALQLVPVKPATSDVLQELYSGDFGYPKDSFLLFHRQGAYAMAEPVTPLVLWWRDKQLNRYVIDTPDPTGQSVPEKQVVVLELRATGFLRTADRNIVGQLSGDTLAATKAITKGKQNVLVRFHVADVDPIGMRVIDPQPLALAPVRSRMWADSWGRIAFQHLQRKGLTQPLSFEALIKAAS